VRTWVAGIFAITIGQEADAVGLELIERVSDFGQATIDIRKRHKGDALIFACEKHAETFAQMAEHQGRMVVWRHTARGTVGAKVSRVELDAGNVWVTVTVYLPDGQIATVEDLPTNPLSRREADEFERMLRQGVANVGKPVIDDTPPTDRLDSMTVVALVLSGDSAVAWVGERAGEWFGILYTPVADENQRVAVMTGGPEGRDDLMHILTETRDESGMPLRIVDGFHGIAATDPHWDGKPTFVCSSCTKEHDVHEMVAANLIAQSRERQRGSNRAERRRLASRRMH
jgi:hypothetical protein